MGRWVVMKNMAREVEIGWSCDVGEVYGWFDGGRKLWIGWGTMGNKNFKKRIKKI